MGSRPGDVIEGIDETPTKSLVLDEALMRIRGKVDSTVKMTIRRRHRRFQVTLTRKALTLTLPQIFDPLGEARSSEGKRARGSI